MTRFQKLTRNVFPALYWHNVHGQQQQQQSKFLMRYQQFASHAYCWAAGPVSKMALQQEKSFCVLRFEVSRSVIAVQRKFRALYSQIWTPQNGAHRKTFPAATPSWKLAPRPSNKHEKRTAGSA